uniref:Deoxyribonuclease TATDN1 n=1 Tax=Plectus sambesii TaxID=2011161 RepID=A0A914VDK5_9BILA
MAAPYQLVDIGANLAHPNYHKDLDQVIERAKAAGVVKVMVTGTSMKSSKSALELAKKHSGFLYATAGVHPHDAKEFTETTVAELEQLAAAPECVAIGECGLDFNRNFSPQDQQRTAFEAQVELACKLGKPLFIHEREAHEDMVAILSRHKANLPPTVIHCFTGFSREAQKYIEMGLNIGLTGFLWKDRLEDGVQFALKNGLIPLDRLVIETDAPYMYPKVNDKKVPKEVKERISDHAKTFLKHCSFDRNEPCSLAATCEMIAAFMNVPAAEVALKTTENAMRIYGLS